MNNPNLSPDATLLYLPTPDGHKIPVRHWPVSKPRAVIHLVHGMAEHSGNYDDIAAFLNQYGYAVLAHDHRCHGLAVADTPLGNVSRHQHWQGILQDMALLHNWIKATYQKTSVIIVAHSMGSFISQAFIQAHPKAIQALALSGSDYLAPWFTKSSVKLAALECVRQGSNGRSPIIHALGFGKFAKTFKPQRTDFDWLSRDSHFVDKYVADPLCGFKLANSYWRDFLSTLATIYQPKNMAKTSDGLPIYLFAGRADPVGHMGKGVQKLAAMYQKHTKAVLSLKLYPEARHAILHESNANEVRYDLLSWLMTVS
ncbi:alpha/beta fold hydrolase [Agitococcus lubricus]|uniref:Alpha-beta hydrolase superfamily lysophospholipase n=1 Tax=Agitococcus lubricus TaxID=1077255 RepID=A0A2T5IX13_9GAMM|nr:alpha/beta fold hydrolase [Agitococcus lubricus]PTQ88490.1 alpha-beta hydrolase superfamily lysophospholipase [Agitococcus lubricus]